ncbi:hypothetical protein [Micromonospora sp. RTP1Z1]|uniref:hypothetical protein n=1 Tax=Micromonospora sp. RTP1Z1 TaxID=2994043 RepID=UPI0029C86889|nr:hypothetical protein [Micromonospora sp. RTP1Z1]
MSEASTDRADRPAEVTDPLLWGLATAVADAHQADEDGACVSPSCVGAAWPCAAWNNAQEAMHAARAAARPTTGALPATSHGTQPVSAAGRDGAAVASAA